MNTFSFIHEVVLNGEVVSSQTIKRCLDCPFYDDAGHEMRCAHKDSPRDGYIISRFPMDFISDLCPLRGETK